MRINSKTHLTPWLISIDRCQILTATAVSCRGFLAKLRHYFYLESCWMDTLHTVITSKHNMCEKNPKPKLTNFSERIQELR